MNLPRTNSLKGIIFDFDGVLAESVPIKTHVFEQMIRERLPAFDAPAIEYYHSHGGTSRVKKFLYIYREIAGKPISEQEANALGEEYAARVRDGVIACPYVPGALEFLQTFAKRIPCFVISGTPTEELRFIVKSRSMSSFFQGVFGSPTDKVTHSKQILADHHWQPSDVCFVGDATTDRDCARIVGLDFVGRHGPHLTPYLDGKETMICDLTELSAALGLS